MIVLVYYSFTSLSTVGFGDFNPKSDLERLMIAFFLLFGVAIFSWIMGNFIDILHKFNAVNADLEEADLLAQFFGVLEKFNRSQPFNLKCKRTIE